MTTFYLPDLGEGLMEAEIREWHVKIGDDVKVDQDLVSVETAKAVVLVPSPQAGKIKALNAKVGDLVKTGAALVEFEGEVTRPDQGSVVGNLEQSSKRLEEEDVIIGSPTTTSATVKAMPAVRALAQQLNVNLQTLKGTGANGTITADDVKQAAGGQNTESLHGVRRVMAAVMTQSHQEVVPVTLIDDADITDLPNDMDITAALIQAIVAGIKAEPTLNAWFDGKNGKRQLFSEVNLGLAMDTPEGLFVPVLKDVASLNPAALRTQIETFKKTVKARTVASADLQGASISLSNFGMIAGRYATPIIVPPMVAILGCGRIREVPLVHAGEIKIRRVAPLSLTFDHRAVTGGEATRFLGKVIQTLESKS